MTRQILALNAGSSNTKAALFQAVAGEASLLRRTRIDNHGLTASAVAARLMEWAQQGAQAASAPVVAHRVVHGGSRFSGPVLLTEATLAFLESLSPLAPLHQPQALEMIRAVAALRPELVQAASFDTAFHRTIPAVAGRFALPRPLHDEGIRRYGFHGLSYHHMSERLAELDPAIARGRILGAHLGSGASLCAMFDGRSRDTTMGFSALDGLVMSTRPGALDPGVVLHLQRTRGLGEAELENLLYRQSGLLGASGISGDVRALLASDQKEAREALDLFVYRAVREAGAMASVLGGLDGVVFSGGVGENSPQIRARICAGLAWLGLELDEQLNAIGGERLISTKTSRVRVWVVPADEERIIACEACVVTD